MKRIMICVLLVAMLLMASTSWAMSSPNFHLDWFTPMDGGGGGPASSANYAANFTIGQTAIGTSNSDHYGTRLGYWYGALLKALNFLPLMTKN